MPGAVPRTSTLALTNVTVPYAVQIANKGYKEACLGNTALLKGINTLDGYVTFEAVAEAHGLQYADAKSFLKKLLLYHNRNTFETFLFVRRVFLYGEITCE